MIFISTPYSHRYTDVTAERIKMVSYYASHLMIDLGQIPISPVLMGDRIRQEVYLPNDFDTWNRLCFSYLEAATEIHVLMLDGWKESTGIGNELIYAREHRIPIKYIEMFQPFPKSVYHFRENEEWTKKERLSQKLEEAAKVINSRKKN